MRPTRPEPYGYRARIRNLIRTGPWTWDEKAALSAILSRQGAGAAWEKIKAIRSTPCANQQ